MSKYRDNLPQLSGDLFLTDGGIETTLIFHDGLDLPLFAAFDILKQETGVEALRRYYRTYAGIARDHRLGFILEAPTWRAGAGWGAQLGYKSAELEQANRHSISLLEEIRAEFETDSSKMVISGCIGPRGDGYVVDEVMTPAESQRYHAQQINIFRDTAADMVTALTMTTVEEAIGVTRAAQDAGMPVVISFTVETDGLLPSGVTLREAIEQVDRATDAGPAYFMINCAHPTHFRDALEQGESWTQRIRGIRANASRMSHAELDEAETLDDGDPVDLAEQYRRLFGTLDALNVVGGCCGTDHRHIEHIARACTLELVPA